MKKMKNKGFTLIELLVVVLIIGILAAIAVPQYQKAVEKSKASQGFILIKTVDEAMRNYHLATNNWPSSFEDLDITLPPSFSGNVKFILNPLTFGTSNKDWSLSFERYTNNSNIILYMARISGKYKGASFLINYNHPEAGINCMERIASGNPIFDPNLPPGAFCEQIMQGKYLSESRFQRDYTL